MSKPEKTREELLAEISALKERDTLLRSILENVPDLIVTATPEGIIRFLNRLPTEASPSVLGTSIYEYITPASREAARECLARVVSTGEPASFEATARCRAAACYEVRVGPIREGGRVAALLLIAADITRRKETERELRAGRESLQMTAAAAGVGLWSFDPLTGKTTWDASLKRLLGFPPEGPDPSQEDCVAMMHPEDYPLMKASLEHINADGAFDEFEMRFKDASGNYRWLLSKGSLFRDEEGRSAKVLGGGIDITRRRRAEEERVKLAALVEHSNDFIALASSDGIVRYLNPAGRKLIGLTELERVKGRKSLLVFVPPEERPALHAQFAQLMQGGRCLGTSVLRNFQTKETIPVEFNSFAIFPEDRGPPLGIALVARDMTGHKQANEERERLLLQERAQRERVAFLSEASRALSLSLDYLTTLRLVAQLTVPQLADITAIDLVDEKGELGPHHPMLIVSDDPEKERLLRDIIRRYPMRPAHPVMRVMQSGKAMLLTPDCTDPREDIAWDEEHLRLLRQLWPLSAVLVPLSARGQRFGVLALMAKERLYDEEDLALVEELGVRAALAIDNARLYQEANNAIRARDEFLYVASHELKTPLTPLWLKLQMLLRLKRKASEEKLFPEAFSHLEGMQKQLARLRRLIDELLDFSRLAEGRLKLEVEEVDLSALVREVLERCKEELGRAGSALRLEAPETLIGRWDRLRLDQIVTNLVSNAIKYGQGAPIQVLLEADHAFARLKVKDHGIGIAQRDQERIFQRFERAVSERHYGGLGLGLWIARQLVEAARGSISVESQPGQGSLFTVLLPR